MKQQTAFQKWLIAFAEEKQLDMSAPVLGDDCMLQVGDVLSAMMGTTAEEQAKIKHIMVLIDLKNGDLMHFIRHAGQVLGPEYKLGM